MSNQFTHIKINPLGFMLDESFDKNMQEALRQKQIAESALELLEALKDAVQVMEPFMQNDGYIAIRVGFARAAINKAEGKA